MQEENKKRADYHIKVIGAFLPSLRLCVIGFHRL